MFFVLFSSAKTNNEDGSPTRELETYRWPCEKHGNSRPQTSNDWPCDLLIVVAKANRTGNWIRLNRNGRSVGIIGIRGIRTPSPLNFALDDRRLNHAVHQLLNGKSRTVAQFRKISNSATWLWSILHPAFCRIWGGITAKSFSIDELLYTCLHMNIIVSTRINITYYKYILCYNLCIDII